MNISYPIPMQLWPADKLGQTFIIFQNSRGENLRLFALYT